MHPEEIKAALRIKGVTLTALASELGLSRSMVTQVIYGYARSKRVEERIAQLLGKSISAIWVRPKPVLRRTRAQVAAVRAGATA
jgi:lambda repressor-like predicted transcriptional regulator